LNEDGAHKIAERTRALTLAAMSLGFGVVQLDVTIVNTALNAIGSGFGGGVSALQWVVNAYAIGFAALILTAGALGDRLGAKRMFIGGFALFTLASAACAVAPSPPLLIAAPAAQGVAAATLVPNSLALLNHAYPEANARGRAVGVWAAGASVALTAGPLAGGVLIALVGWRAIFLVNVPIGLAGLWLTWRYAGETPTAGDRRLDLAGQAAAILALGILAGAMIEGGKLGWRNPLVLGGLAAAGVLAALFVLQERRAVQPMLPLQLFRGEGLRLGDADRRPGQYRLLWPDLRPQSLLPADRRPVAVPDRSGVHADAGRGAARQLACAASQRATRRAGGDRHRRADLFRGRVRLAHRPQRNALRLALRATRGAGRRTRPAGPADDRHAAG